MRICPWTQRSSRRTHPATTLSGFAPRALQPIAAASDFHANGGLLRSAIGAALPTRDPRVVCHSGAARRAHRSRRTAPRTPRPAPRSAACDAALITSHFRSVAFPAMMECSLNAARDPLRFKERVAFLSQSSLVQSEACVASRRVAGWLRPSLPGVVHQGGAARDAGRKASRRPGRSALCASRGVSLRKSTRRGRRVLNSTVRSDSCRPRRKDTSTVKLASSVITLKSVFRRLS